MQDTKVNCHKLQRGSRRLSINQTCQHQPGVSASTRRLSINQACQHQPDVSASIVPRIRGLIHRPCTQKRCAALQLIVKYQIHHVCFQFQLSGLFGTLYKHAIIGQIRLWGSSESLMVSNPDFGLYCIIYGRLNYYFSVPYVWFFGFKQWSACKTNAWKVWQIRQAIQRETSNAWAAISN